MSCVLHTVLRPGGRLHGHLRLTEHIEDSAPVYSGTHSVMPSALTQTLPTKGKKLTADVTVLPIPVQEIANDAGGYTLIIGG